MAKQSADEIVEELMGSHFAETQVDLPSGKTVRLTPITFEVEKQMVSRTDAEGDTVDFILEKCVKDADLDELMEIDANYILFKIREISYGPEYKFIQPCPACGSEQHFSVNVGELPVRRLEDDGDVEMVLPMSGKEVVLRRATRADRKHLEDGEIMMDSIWRFVKSFGGYDRKDVISKVIPKLTAGDLETLIKVVTASDYGLQTTIRMKCNQCGHDAPMALPLTQGFFSVS
jgi:rRNA maturation protein Nop10